MAYGELRIESGVKSIPAGQYAGQSITDIIFPPSLEEIGERAFAGCTELERLWIPGTVKRIGSEAFWGCGKLRRVFLPDSVESIGHDAFDYRDCEIFCEAQTCPSGWYRDYYETLDYDEYQGQMILSLYESWCGYDVEVQYPEWYSESIPARTDPRGLRWNAAEEEVRSIWDREERVLERETAERMPHSIQSVRESERQREERALEGFTERIEGARRSWEEASAPYRDLPGTYPEEIFPAAAAYIDSLRSLKSYYVGSHNLNRDYETTWKIFRVYCELAPRFSDASFRKELDSVKKALHRLVYYGAGYGMTSEKRERIDRAYEESMRRIEAAREKH